MSNNPILKTNDVVYLKDELDSIIPEGFHTVSKVNEDGSFHVGGNTAVWPSRIDTLKIA